MFQTALVLLCTAQIIHFSRYWIVLSLDLRRAYLDRKLKTHLDWSETGSLRKGFGDARPGTAMRRMA